MGKKDSLAKAYISQPEIFADIVNLSLFHGEEELSGKQITELDTTFKTKRRDILKRCTLKNGESRIIGIETQSFVDPSMPIRILCYDAEVMEQLLKKKQKENKEQHLKGGEYLSGLRFEDRLEGVDSIVLNLSKERWHGARDIRDLVRDPREMNGYKIRVLDPSEMSEKQIGKCKSEVRKLLLILKYSQEGKGVVECIQREEYKEVGEETAQMIVAVTGMKLKIQVKEGKVNMCKELEAYAKQCKREGKKEGEKKGKQEEKINTAKRMLENGLAEEIILKCCEISDSELNKLKSE